MLNIIDIKEINNTINKTKDFFSIILEKQMSISKVFLSFISYGFSTFNTWKIGVRQQPIIDIIEPSNLTPCLEASLFP